VEHLEDPVSTLELTRPVAPAATVSEPLTRRELVVLEHLSEDVTLEEIASTLFVTRNTVKSQVRSLYRKLGVSTRADAVAWARAAGLR
jgi:LuxR family transcriptional regulator, transcriptional regulator of spore coat protein